MPETLTVVNIDKYYKKINGGVEITDIEQIKMKITHKSLHYN